MANRKHLPVFGVGPIYGILAVAMTVAGIFLSEFGLLNSGKFEMFPTVVNVVAAVIIAIGILLWFMAVVQARIAQNILKNELVTTGIYAWVRNPLYCAILFICTGALLLAHNLWLLFIPVVIWGFLSLMLRQTEEKWLLRQYGVAYEVYCRRTNRCLPWPPSQKNK